MSYKASLSNAEIFGIMCNRIQKSVDLSAVLGDGFARATKAVPPFLIGNVFPEVYVEFPLKGDPAFDVSVLYYDLEPGEDIKSEYAGNCREMLDAYSSMKKEYRNVCCGFEIDTSAPDPYPAAVHFEPYQHTDLVIPFCDSLRLKSYGELYLKAIKRLETTWPPAFFGIFRGRDNAPLRVCGYIQPEERTKITENAKHLEKIFKTIGFEAYDDTMMEQIREAMSIAPLGIDYQIDIYANEKLGETFSLDLSLKESGADAVRSSLATGSSSKVIDFLLKYDIADERVGAISDIASSIAVPEQITDGKCAVRSVIIKPAWIKIRWKAGILQNAKCYCMLKSFVF